MQGIVHGKQRKLGIYFHLGATCDTANQVCELGDNVCYPSDENQRANEGNPPMSYLMWRYKSKQNSPWYSEYLPENSCKPQVDIVQLSRFRAIHLLKKEEIMTTYNNQRSLVSHPQTQFHDKVDKHKHDVNYRVALDLQPHAILLFLI